MRSWNAREPPTVKSLWGTPFGTSKTRPCRLVHHGQWYHHRGVITYLCVDAAMWQSLCQRFQTKAQPLCLLPIVYGEKCRYCTLQTWCCGAHGCGWRKSFIISISVICGYLFLV